MAGRWREISECCLACLGLVCLLGLSLSAEKRCGDDRLVKIVGKVGVVYLGGAG